MIWSHNGKEMSVSCDNVVTRHEQHYFVGFLAQSFYKRLRNGQDIPRRCCSSVAFSYFTFDKSTSADPFFALRCAGQTLPRWHGRFHSGIISALKWSYSKQLFDYRKVASRSTPHVTYWIQLVKCPCLLDNWEYVCIRAINTRPLIFISNPTRIYWCPSVSLLLSSDRFLPVPQRQDDRRSFGNKFSSVTK